MKTGEVRGPSLPPCDDEFLSELLHELSQPITTLECGLELAIRYDTTLVQVRHRLKVLLEAARVLHARLAELRAMGPQKQAGKQMPRSLKPARDGNNKGVLDMTKEAAKGRKSSSLAD